MSSSCKSDESVKLEKISEIKEEKQEETEQQEKGEEHPKTQVTKAKLRSVLEAASALTSLGGDEEEETETDSEKKDSLAKRHIPDHKKQDAALTFPEKLMNMMQFVDNAAENKEEYCIAWLADGLSFVIRNPDEFTRLVLPKFFKATKFSSFTRKLYRWGFRQVNRGIGPEDPIIFGNEYFQREKPDLMVRMRSITAAGSRKAQSLVAVQAHVEAQRKRPLDPFSLFDFPQKRLLLGLQQQQHQQQQMQKFAQVQPFNFGVAAMQPNLMKSLNFPQQPNPMQQYYMSQMSAASAQCPQHDQSHQARNIFPMQGAPGQFANNNTVDIVNAAINALRHAP